MSVAVTLAWAMCALLGAQSPRVTDDASLGRIKAALAKPAPKLVINVPKPDFRVNIDAIRPFADIFDLPPWVTPPSDYDAPKTGRSAHDSTIVGVGFDPYAAGHAVSKAIRSRRAHSEVMETIMEYCRLHRDEPGAAGICGGPPR